VRRHQYCHVAVDLNEGSAIYFMRLLSHGHHLAQNDAIDSDLRGITTAQEMV